MNSQKPKTRRAKLEDVPKLRKLRIQLVRENPRIFGVIESTERKRNLDYYKKWIKEYSQKDAAILLLEVYGDLVGMAAIKREDVSNPEIGYIGSLGVLKKFQGKGYGRLLDQKREHWVKEKTKFKKLKCIVAKFNNKRLEILKKHGYIVVGEGKYYGVPEYYLEKDLKFN